MSDLNNKLLEMMEKGASLEKIVEETGLSYRQLYYRVNLLRDTGYYITNKYLYNGKIMYFLSRTLPYNNSPMIEMSSENDEFECVFISDLHLGSVKERIDLLNAVYEYCVKENIHIVINSGDVLSGLFGPDEKIIDNFVDQINYAINVYPSIPNIITFICFGNHDLHSLKMIGLDAAKVISSKRHDLVNLGYGNGSIDIKDDKLFVCHSGTPRSNIVDTRENNRFIVSGGGHRFKMSFNNNFTLFLPTLSDLKFTEDEILPAFVRAKLDLHKGKLNKGFFDHILISKDTTYRIGNFVVDLGKNKKFHTPQTTHVDDFMVEDDTQILNLNK